MSAHVGPTATTDRPIRQSLPLYANPFRQMFSASTWRGTQFLLVYLVMSWAMFAVVFTAATVTLTLAVTLVGLPLLIVTAAVIRNCASAERLRLRPLVHASLAGSYHRTSGRGLFANIRAAWTDPAIWRNFAYFIGLFPFLWALDLTVLTVWMAFIGCVALPAWYWAPEQTFPGGTARGAQFGYFPHGPHGPGGVGIYVDTPAKAVGVALIFLVFTLLFSYVVVLTARMHARVAYSLVGAPEDPLAEAKSVLTQPGPLGPLRAARRNGTSGRSTAAT
jgi:Putative sensor